MDSALAAACQVTGGAPDLLAVTFRATASAADREAAAREVGGTLVSRGEHQAAGAWYLRVPGGADLHAVQDQLILLPTVQSVSTLRCPP